MTVLQWSHDFSVMETKKHPHRMQSSIGSFNGAMTFQSWKLSVDNEIGWDI